jgi:hypothetical protein
MGYDLLILAVAALLTIPFALLIRRRAREGKTQTPQRSIVLTFVAILMVLFGLSALDSWFYPYGWPGHEMPGLRASSVACAHAYAQATTAAESARVDTLFFRPAADTGVLSCGTLRREHLPRCAPGSRCARLRSALHLPAS